MALPTPNRNGVLTLERRVDDTLKFKELAGWYPLATNVIVPEWVRSGMLLDVSFNTFQQVTAIKPTHTSRAVVDDKQRVISRQSWLNTSVAILSTRGPVNVIDAMELAEFIGDWVMGEFSVADLDTPHGT